jgi:hypothetical protein
MKNHRKANALEHLGEIILVATALASGIGMNHLFAKPADDFLVATVITIAFVAHGLVARLVTGTFGPAIDRLRLSEADTEAGA